MFLFLNKHSSPIEYRVLYLFLSSFVQTLNFNNNNNNNKNIFIKKVEDDFNIFIYKLS